MSSFDEAVSVLDKMLSDISYGRVVENETIEIKQASNNYSEEEFGIYFSALSNEANIRNCLSAGMIFGVSDRGIPGYCQDIL